MNKIKEVQRLNERELERVVPSNASWHTDYRDTAYIYIGGLPLDLSEGDVITIFSQYGEPVWVRLMRDKETGKSKGFAWLKYEDQRSCDLAVDNLGGGTVMGRLLAVDHTRYQKKDNEDEDEFYVGQDKQIGPRHGDGSDESEQEEDDRPVLKEELELAQLMREHDQDDPMKAYMIDQKKEEIAEARKAVTKTVKKDHRKHSERSRHEDRPRTHHSRRSPDHDDRDRRRERRPSPAAHDRRRHAHRSHRDPSLSPRRDTRRERSISPRKDSRRERPISPRKDSRRERSISPRKESRRHRDRDYPSRPRRTSDLTSPAKDYRR